MNNHFMPHKNLNNLADTFHIEIETCTGHLGAKKAEHINSDLRIFQESACGCAQVSVYQHRKGLGKEIRDHMLPCDHCKGGYRAPTGTHGIDMCDMHYRYMNIIISGKVAVDL